MSEVDIKGYGWKGRKRRGWKTCCGLVGQGGGGHEPVGNSETTYRQKKVKGDRDKFGEVVGFKEEYYKKK
jgi:hypothetical protein